MKKEYITPAMQTVMLQHRHQLLSGSPLTSTGTNLVGDDEIGINETPADTDFWGR